MKTLCGATIQALINTHSSPMLLLLASAVIAHGNHGVVELLTPEQRERECELTDPDLYYYSVPLRLVSLGIIFCVSLSATLLPLIYKKYFKKKNDKDSTTNMILSCLKLFGTGVLISTAFIHMFPPSVQIFENKCLPDAFRLYINWPGTIFLIGFLFSHFIQQQATNFIRSSMAKKDDGSALSVEKHEHDHIHHIALNEKESSILAYALEFGLCSHSLVIGFTVGTEERDFTPLFYAILIHQFFEGMALSSVVVETTMAKMSVIMMVVLYCLSTPLGVLLGIIFRSYNTETVAIQLSIGISEAFCAGVLTYDAVGNLMSLHFFGDYYSKCSIFEKNMHILALWGGVFVMGLLGLWA
jgi:solute carrier family 39 (zinc transporter), member 1/2/3